MRFSRIRLAALAAVTLSLACGKDSGVAGVLVVAVVDVTPGITGVVVGQSTPLVAAPKTSSGLPVPGRTITWTSLNTTIASVSSTGLVTGNTVGGPVTIRATVDGVHGDALITVNAVPVDRVTVAPSSTPVPTGQSVQLTATAFDAGGATLSGRSFLWESGDPNIAAVTTDGRVLGVSPGGPVTITATSEGKSGSSAVTVTPRLADRLGFAQQPTTTPAGAPFNPTVKVAIQDVLLSTVTGATDPVTIALAANPGGATLSGTTTVTAVNGVATFGDLTLNRVGAGYTFLAQSGSLISVISNAFNIVAGTAGRLTLATPPPSTARSGVSLTTQPVVQLVDASGNNVSQAGVVVTATLVTGAGTLGGTVTAITNASGAAIFTNLVISGPVGNYTLGFNAAAVTGVNSGSITLSAGTAAALAIITQPSSTAQNGFPLGQQPVIQIQDGAGNPVSQSGTIVTAQLETGTGTLGGATAAATNGAGFASFTSLAINGGAGAYTLRFTAPGLTPVLSSPITLGAGVPSQITITLQPSAAAQVGVPFLQQPQVQLRDASGNPVAFGGVTISATPSTGGTLQGTTSAVTNSGGLAIFGTLGLSGPTGTYTLTFSAAGLTGAISNSITLSAGAAAQLGLTTEPSPGAQSGVAFGQQPVVQVQDVSGNPVAMGVTVVAAIASGPVGGVLGGTLSLATDGSGAAAFTNLKITGSSGAYSLRFTAAGLADAVSQAVTLGSGTATTIAAVSATSQSAIAGTAVAAPPSVKVTDASLNPVAGVGVTFAVITGAGTVLPTTQILTNGSGIATATSWTLGNTAGTNNNTVRATSSGLTGSPVTFTASGLVGPASVISANSVTSQSATVGTAVAAPPSVKVTDANGNAVSGVSVTFTLTGAGGSISPASPAAVSTNALGIAALTSWTLGAAAGTNNYTVTATASVPNGSPVVFTASGTAAAAGSMVAVSPTTLSATVNTAVATAPSVKVTDGSSNPVAGVSVTFTLTGAGGSTAPVSPATVLTNGSGIASLTTWTLGTVAGANNYTVTAASTGLTSVTFTASATAGVANQVTANSVTSQSAQVGTAVGAPPQVKVTDAFGNPVSGFAVSFAVTAGGGTVVPAAPTTVATNASGVAATTSWTLGPSVGTNTVKATAGALGGSPVQFDATGTAGSATNIAANSATSLSAVAGTAVASPPSVKVTDGIGNPVQGVVVTFAVTGGGGSISGPASIATDVNGIATVGGWTLGTVAGTNNNTLAASSGSLTGSPVNFIASGTVGAAALMTAQSAVSQSATVGSTVTAPSVKVTDSNGNVVSGFSVTFTLTQTGGTNGSIAPATPASVSTNASGIASLTTWTLGESAGVNNNTVTATGSGVATVTFNASGNAGAAATAVANSATTQSGTEGTTVTPPSVLVTDGFGNPVSGFSVMFTASGQGNIVPVSPASISTNASGIAALTTWTLGPVAGTNNNVVTAAPGALTPIVFTASATAGAAANLTATSSVSQSATVGTDVPAPPQVKVTDNGGNPIAGVSVTFAVTAGGGAIAPTTPINTDVSGLATLTSWTLGNTAGANTVTATAGSLSGSPVAFTATGTAGAATTIAGNSVLTQSANAGTAVTAPPSVRVIDAFGNPVQGVGVVFTVTSGSGTISPASPATVNTDVNGVATLTSWTLDPTAGNANQVDATSGSLSGSPVTFTATGTVGPAAGMIANTATTQSGTVATSVTAPSVKVSDAHGNPVTGFSVTFTLTAAASGGSISPATPATVLTDGSGNAALTTWTLGNTAGTTNNTVVASGTGLTSVTFNASGTADVAANISAASVQTQSAQVFTNVSTPPSVLVADSHGNPKAGVAVVFTITDATTGRSTSPASGSTIMTNASGLATLTSWTLGQEAGTENNTVEATAGLSGSPVVFTASGQPGPVTHITVITEPSTLDPAPAAFTQQPLVQALDSFNNPVAGVLITASLDATGTGAGTLTGTLTSTTNSSGQTAYIDLAVTTVGDYVLRFTSASGVGPPFILSGQFHVP